MNTDAHATTPASQFTVTPAITTRIALPPAIIYEAAGFYEVTSSSHQPPPRAKVFRCYNNVTLLAIYARDIFIPPLELLPPTSHFALAPMPGHYAEFQQNMMNTITAEADITDVTMLKRSPPAALPRGEAARYTASRYAPRRRCALHYAATYRQMSCRVFKDFSHDSHCCTPPEERMLLTRETPPCHVEDEPPSHLPPLMLRRFDIIRRYRYAL